MAPVFARISDVNATRSDWALRLRLVGAYNVPVFKNPNQIQSFECVFRDIEGSTIRGSARAPHMDSVRPKLREGNLYIISNFMVSKDELRYKTATHTHKFSFYGKTMIRQIRDSSFPNNRFSFKAFDEIAKLKKTDENLLFDVIGRLVEMHPPTNMPTQQGDKLLMEVEIEDMSGRRLTITLWEEFVEKVIPFYNQQTFDPVVIVMQFCRPKVFNDNVKVSNTYHCTQMFVNDNVWEINEFKKQVIASPSATRQVAITQSSGSGASPGSEFASGRAVVKNLQEICEGEDGSFWVYCTIAEIENPKDIWYMACVSCHRKLNHYETKWNCRHCGDVEPNNNFRYKLEVRVIDETYNALFIVWDTEGQVIFGKTAYELKTEDDAEPGVLDYFIGKLADGNVLFKVSRKTDHTRGGRVTYVVTKVTNDPDLLSRFCRSYVQSQESDLISKLGNSIDFEYVSSEDEVTTPDKKNKENAVEEDVITSPDKKLKGRKIDVSNVDEPLVEKKDGDLEHEVELKVKRKLMDELDKGSTNRKAMKQEK